MACFIVQHDLASFKELPNCIWNTEQNKDQIPPRYKQIRPGDCWVAFAYPDNLVVGFFECVSEAKYGGLPQPAQGEGWFIVGKPFCEQPIEPIRIESLETILGKNIFRNQAIIPGVSEEEFQKLRAVIQK